MKKKERKKMKKEKKKQNSDDARPQDDDPTNETSVIEETAEDLPTNLKPKESSNMIESIFDDFLHEDIFFDWKKKRNQSWLRLLFDLHGCLDCWPHTD